MEAMLVENTCVSTKIFSCKQITMGITICTKVFLNIGNCFVGSYFYRMKLTINDMRYVFGFFPSLPELIRGCLVFALCPFW